MHDLINAAKIKAGALLISTSLLTLTIGNLRIYKSSHPTDWGTHISFSTATESGAWIILLGGIFILIEGCLGKSFISLWKHRTHLPSATRPKGPTRIASNQPAENCNVSGQPGFQIWNSNRRWTRMDADKRRFPQIVRLVCHGSAQTGVIS